MFIGLELISGLKAKPRRQSCAAIALDVQRNSGHESEWLIDPIQEDLPPHVARDDPQSDFSLEPAEARRQPVDAEA